MFSKQGKKSRSKSLYFFLEFIFFILLSKRSITKEVQSIIKKLFITKFFRVFLKKKEACLLLFPTNFSFETARLLFAISAPVPTRSLRRRPMIFLHKRNLNVRIEREINCPRNCCSWIHLKYLIMRNLAIWIQECALLDM